MWRWHTLAAVVSCVLFCLMAQVAEAQESGKRVAVLVGINAYQKPFFRNLKFAERDVEETETELKRLGFDVVKLIGEKATRKAIDDALKAAAEPLSKDDVMLVMFSGHSQQLDVTRADGSIHSDGFYCPVDAVNNKPETMVSLSYVIDDILAPNVGRKLLLIDACRDVPKDPSRGKGIQGQRTDLPEGTAVLFSCLAGQQSWESDELQHGLFTYCVLEGIRQQSDDEITWSSVVAHVDKRMASPDMRARMGKPQEPIPAGGVPYTLLGRIGSIPLKPGEVVTNTTGMKLVLVPAGEFLMGSPTTEANREDVEGPQHRVQITKPFLMGQYEVTQGEWEAVMGSNPSYFAASGAGKEKVAGLDTSRFPVEKVSWYDAVEFCNKLSEKENLSPYYALSNIERNEGAIQSATVSVTGGQGYRLPTEAEWEYACRAGTKSPFHFGATTNGREANVDGRIPYGTQTEGPSLGRTTAVGSYSPNGFGLYDLHGNVGEWCADWYDATAYQDRAGTTRDPLVSSAAENRRVLRGGAWYILAGDSRSAYRPWSTPGLRDSDAGFRLARTP